MTPEQEHEIGRCIFREANDAFFILRPADLRVVDANPAAQRLTGTRKKQLLAMTLYDLIERREPGDLADPIRACNSTAYLISTDGYFVKTADGGRRAVHVSVGRIHTDEAPLGLLIARDISRLKQAEASLRESEQRFRAFMDNSPAQAWITDDAGVVLFANEAFLKLAGRPREQIVGKTVADLVPPEFAAQYLQHNHEALNRNEAVEHVESFPRTDGRIGYGLVLKFPVPDTSGQRLIGGVAVDISERKWAEERAAGLLDELLTAQEDERRRVARELHDVTGQSLTSLLIGLRTLQDATTLDAARETAANLRQIAVQALDEVRELAWHLRPAVLDDIGFLAAIERFAENCSQSYGLKIDVLSRGLGTDRLSVPMESALYRVVQEAVTNVAKHAAAKHVTIEIAGESGHLTLSIGDDGAGFDYNATVRSTDASQQLGLRTMRERVALLGGEFAIESRPGGGTKLTVRVPFSSARPTEPQANPA